MRGMVNQIIEQLLATTPNISSTEVARLASVSRQAAHKRLSQLVGEGRLTVAGRARAARYSRAPQVTAAIPLRTTRPALVVEVASAGSLYRLSARLLMDGVGDGEVTLDFTGVVDLGEEFLEEIFLVWAPAHPGVEVHVANLAPRFAPMLMGFARRNAPATTVVPLTGS